MGNAKVPDISSYYDKLTEADVEEARTISTLLFISAKKARIDAADMASEFAPTVPFSVLYHVVENGLEDLYDEPFIEHLLVLHRCRWIDMKKDDKDFDTLNKKLLSALSFNDPLLRLTADLM